MLPQVNEIIAAIETDEQVKVVVFDSAVEGFFLIHLDFLAKLDDLAYLPSWTYRLASMARDAGAPEPFTVVSIALIRGRATGAGLVPGEINEYRFERQYLKRGWLSPRHCRAAVKTTWRQASGAA
jgi:hypothetical protein